MKTSTEPLNLLNYVNGEWTGKYSATFSIINPATKEIIGTMPDGTKEDVLGAIEGAQAAFEIWRRFTAEDRSNYLEKFYQRIIERKEEIARIITLENGKPLKEARGEVLYAASFVKWYAEEGKRVYGKTIPSKSNGQRIQVLKQPLGVVAAITPWNFPAAMITRKMAPALAAGCTFIVKPPKETPLTAAKLMECADEAGLPSGVVNMVVTPDEVFSETIQTSEEVRKLTFTGSTEVGRLLMKQSADLIKNISLELGGQAPLIVLDDADIEKAIEGTMASKFRNAGQTCICANRLYVQSGIYDAFVSKLKVKIEELQVGNGLEDNVDIGPLINQAGYDKVVRHVEDALKRGAKAEVGGKGYQNDVQDAPFYPPTLLLEAKEDMLCMKEETFGPVVPIQKIESDEEAIRLANDSPFGLAAYYFTESMARGTKFAEALDYGIIGWNHGAPSTAQAPFGGMKQSGLGREGGSEGIEAFLETKYLSIGID
ncbi:NAD-dependent succinate-semialdehyde dehydrogenase [Halobacillus salinarum]|uniref:NAD-dependent succinate-semialdehyde dehydrogenase n=1 Tax=Halobacillus salinarum TaxID=2932257 RepID=A0ABY4EJJ4_9BACI|nr:NAD-dependent succinate-semialdehyde dehydrogenase [Halobacillus salinarum]UOQ44266.1 NAD-dependent succinate-semialdehyde dehydrogenase [Halobacillus salinarum]